MQSWIHIHDLANVFLFSLKNKLSGIFNGVGPNPVSNQELTSAVAQELNKSLILPNVPKFIMKLALGEMHTILFESQNVSSQKLSDLGFEFEYKTIHTALKQLLQK